MGTISKKTANKIRRLTDEYVEGMRKLGTEVSKRDARRIICRRMGMLRNDEKQERDLKFQDAIKTVLPKYKSN